MGALDSNPERQEVAIMGQVLTYHDQVRGLYFGDDYQSRYDATFADVFSDVDSGETPYGIVAIENSTAGSILPNYDLLGRYPDIKIVGEVYLKINHKLAGLPGATLDTITTVFSHEQALAQCANNIASRLPGATAIKEGDTTSGLMKVIDLGDPSNAAIGSGPAVEHFGLQVLDQNMEDNAENYTRFLVISKDHPGIDTDGEQKVSMLIDKLSADEDDLAPGTLYRAVGCFALNGIALTKVESRPTLGEAWHYKFYFDCLAGVDDPKMQAALDALDAQGAQWRLLGSYTVGKIY